MACGLPAESFLPHKHTPLLTSVPCITGRHRICQTGTYMSSKAGIPASLLAIFLLPALQICCLANHFVGILYGPSHRRCGKAN